MTHQRAIVIVIDGLGIGALPDAVDYGDQGADTLGHICQAVPNMDLKHLAEMGLGSLGIYPGIPPVKDPISCFGRMAEASAGKDTVTGHWELMGLVNKTPFPTYPQGFPHEIIEAVEKSIGRKTLGNTPASGTEIIQDLGEEHLDTGWPIVYTSADSVLQMAAHEKIIPVDELYQMCEKARRILVPPHGVLRVIARPFEGSKGDFSRTTRRHDLTLPPPSKTLLNLLHEQKYDTAGIGKINDIFAGSGLTQTFQIRNNREGVDRTLDAMERINKGLILTNLVDFDTLYGHRNNPQGYAEALMDLDLRVPELLGKLRPLDLLVFTADHGCDPTTSGSDHTREYVPLLIHGTMLQSGVNFGTRSSMADLAKTLQDFFSIQGDLKGNSFWKTIVHRKDKRLDKEH